MSALDANGIARQENGLDKLRDAIAFGSYPIIPQASEFAVGEADAGEDLGLAKSSSNPVLPLWWHGDTEPGANRTWLVEDLLPEIGTAIIAGPWGTYKTFVAIDLAISVMAGGTFAGRSVNKQCGVLYVAAEGAFEIPLRLQAAYNATNNSGAQLPFAMADQCPRLLNRDALSILQALAKAVDDRLQNQHDLRLGLIIIDTMAAAAGFEDENSNAEAQRAMGVCAALAKKFQCLVVVIDHFGKAVETGTRGGSAKEGSADTVLAILAGRDISGNVTSPRLAVRKVRGAKTGSEIPFGVQLFNIGVGEKGNSQKTLVIDWGPEGAAAKKADADPWPKSLRIFSDALNEVLINFGSDMTPFPDGPVLRCVDAERLREEFYKRYPADGDTRRRAYNRAVKNAQERRLINVRDIDGTSFIWKITLTVGRDERDIQDSSLVGVSDVPTSVQ
jgi:RecA/RadA recombinase